MKKTKFIVLEGMDGCGKGAQISFLKRDFPKAIFTREPGGTEIGEEIRALIMKHDNGPWADFFLHFAQRAHHLPVIREHLLNDRTVISDRSDASTFAFQVCGEGCSLLREPFFSMRELVYGNILGKDVSQPYYIILDLSAEESRSRVVAANRGVDDNTHYDARSLDYYERVRVGYLELASLLLDSFSIIDASRPPEKVYADVRSIVAQ